MAAYVGCIAGAIQIDDYRAGLLAAGFEHVEIVDSGADLNAYAKVENQSGCCSPAMAGDASNPFQVVEEPAALRRLSVSVAARGIDERSSRSTTSTRPRPA